MIGHHTIEIIVTDGANNTTNKIVNFDIIKNNLIGCGTDPTCYKDNYLDIIYLALLFFSVRQCFIWDVLLVIHLCFRLRSVS